MGTVTDSPTPAAPVGTGCPASMTSAAVPVLRRSPTPAATWVPELTGRGYVPGLRAVDGTGSVFVGTAMTEKQGGPDGRADTTVAERARPAR